MHDAEQANRQLVQEIKQLHQDKEHLRSKLDFIAQECGDIE